MKNPPVWTVELFNDFCAPISRYAEKHDLPMPVTEKGLIPLCDLGKEYGRGFYGVVWPTEKEGTVFKITTDETEAHFIQTAINLRNEKNISPEGIVEYYDIVAIPRKHLKRNIFMTWREEVTSTGIDYYSRSAHEFGDMLMNFKEYAHDIMTTTRERWRKIKNADAYWKWLDESLKDDRSWVARSLSTCQTIAMELQNNQPGTYVGGALREYMDAGILLADIHTGNVGKVFRGNSSYYVISDPGHAVVLKKSLSAPEIEVIR